LKPQKTSSNTLRMTAVTPPPFMRGATVSICLKLSGPPMCFINDCIGSILPSLLKCCDLDYIDPKLSVGNTGGTSTVGCDLDYIDPKPVIPFLFLILQRAISSSTLDSVFFLISLIILVSLNWLNKNNLI